MDRPVITSATNPTVRALRKLTSNGKQRLKERRFVAHGVHLVRSYLESGGRPDQCVIAESAIDNPEVAELLACLKAAQIDVAPMKDSLYESFSDVHAAVGISLVAATPAAQTPARCQTDALLLDDVQDPGNLGTILRTAAAAGIDIVYTSPATASAWSPKALRAGMGAQFSLQMHEGVDLATVVQAATVPVYATLLSARSTPLYDHDLTEPAAWLFGSEGRGVADELAAIASQHLTIPQADSTVESLNVAAAVAVCLYEQYRQRRI